MDTEAYRNYLLSVIPRSRLVSGRREVLCRCFECPDSRNLSSAHFYISIPQSDDEPSFYHCFKCNCAGVVTYNKLIEWGIYNEQIASSLIDHNLKCRANNKNDKYFSFDKFNLVRFHTRSGDISNYKLDYINKRLGTQFSFKDLEDLKIVLNLNDVIGINGLRLTRYPDIVEQLDINFLGFISIDNSFVNMRRLVDEGQLAKSIDKRYINYKLIDKFDTSQRFYTIPTSVDLLQYPLKINIAEGPFDILSIYENVRHREPGIYSSVAGSNYIGTIMYFIDTFKLPYAEIHVYPDNDASGSNDKMRYISSVLKPIGYRLFVHRNLYEGEKDFGVHKSHIREGAFEI